MLKVTINSFAYKNGLPTDESGNGGGFIFDCRGLPNPYKNEKFRYFSGNMSEIEDFFSGNPVVNNFLNHIIAVTDICILNYIERDFDNLQISFGCTGGQHRSVYLAEKLNKAIKQKYHAKVVTQLTHREESQWILCKNDTK